MILDLRRLSRIDGGRGGALRNLYRLGLRLRGGRRIRKSVPLGVRVSGSIISEVRCLSLEDETHNLNLLPRSLVLLGNFRPRILFQESSKYFPTYQPTSLVSLTSSDQNQVLEAQ
jgi:hypothetical protein